MELKDIQAFFAVVEEGNISHAASRLDIAQPVLSRQMKRLEASLGVALFERGNRRIRLTQAGQILYTRSQNILGMIDETLREIEEIGSGISGSLKLGTVVSSGALILPSLMNEFHKKFPKVVFQVWEGEGSRIFELLDNRTIEIAITRTQPDREHYESLILEGEPLVILMKKNAARGQNETKIALKELQNETFIVPVRWKGIFIANCKKAGFTPKIICESDSIVQNILAVREGLGVALVPASALHLIADDEIIFKKLTEPEMQTHTVVSWMKDRKLSSIAHHFLNLLQTSLFEQEA